MSPRVTAADRLRRIVTILPWIAHRDGPTIDEICERFVVDRNDLLADLDVAFLIGVPPYTPDQLIDVIVEDDRVWVTLGEYFTRPLTLSATEALGLLSAASIAAAFERAEADDPLTSAMAKLRGALGLASEDALAVSLGSGTEHLAALRDALEPRRLVEIDYYSHGRDEQRRRVIEPLRLWAAQGQWYVDAWCRAAEARRRFRVDRIVSATVLDELAPTRTLDPPASGAVFNAAGAESSIVFELADDDRWLLDSTPLESIDPLGHGRVRVKVAIGGRAFLERLLLRLGDRATILTFDSPEGTGANAAAAVRSAAARRVLQCYATPKR